MNYFRETCFDLTKERGNGLLMDFSTNLGTLCPNNDYYLPKRTLLIIILLCISTEYLLFLIYS